MRFVERFHPQRLTRKNAASVLALSIAAGGLLGMSGCNPPNFTTDADVMTVLNQPRTDAELETLGDTGRRLFLRHSCNNCHVVEGATRGAPRLADLYTTQAVLLDGSTISRDRLYVIRSILHGQDQIVAGYPQQMTSFRHLPADDVAALVVYLERYSPPPSVDESHSRSALPKSQE